MPVVHQNSNLHDSTLSTVKELLNTLQICSNPKVEGTFNTKLGTLVHEMQEIVLEEFANDTGFSGECVSLSVPVDRRQKCKRIMSKSEPKRKKSATLSRGTNHIPAFSTHNDDYGLEI